MTAYEVRELLVRRLVREHGGGLGRWRTVVGAIRVYPIATHAHCNWRADPSGTIREVEAVERMIDRIGAEHPILD